MVLFMRTIIGQFAFLMHKHRKIKGNSRFGSLCGPGRLFCFSMAKKRCLCYTCLSDFACGAEKEKLKKREVRGVQAAARQHGGTMTVKWENNWFTVRILLSIPEKE